MEVVGVLTKPPYFFTLEGEIIYSVTITQDKVLIKDGPSWVMDWVYFEWIVEQDVVHVIFTSLALAIAKPEGLEDYLSLASDDGLVHESCFPSSRLRNIHPFILQAIRRELVRCRIVKASTKLF